jgi:RNA polymerase sigma factor (sigma-70 family)
MSRTRFAAERVAPLVLLATAFLSAVPEPASAQVIALDEVSLVSPRPDAESRLELEDNQKRLLRLIRRESADRQQLLILKFVEQMSNREIAQIMGRSEGAIKSLYHRTLLALREAWADERKRLEKAGEQVR